ncbi:MAG: GerMN domain-containing protein, partial [Thermoanaerobaculaceae bacterium]|nr:GerMN domain-containing protein [Thermoanaerobaculaceae bacterium]
MKTLRPIVAALVVLGVLAAVVLLGRRHRAPAPPPAAEEATPAPTPVPAALVLFFPGDDAMLHREAREVPELPAGVPARIKLVMEELVAGSHQGFAPAVPWGATVQAVFLDRDGNAWVDLTPPPADVVAGTDGELDLAYAAVNSIAANCPGVRRVQLLFGGQQVATFGHLD